MDIKALITIHVCAIIVVMLLTACVTNKGKKTSAEPVDDYYFNKFKFEGHEYISLSGNYFIHSESCPCKKGK